MLLVSVAAMAAAGYLVAALVFFPAPLLPNEREVPRVLDLDEAAATREVTGADLTAAIAGRAPHPTAATGTVIWQDPPPGVALPRGASVALTVSSGVPSVTVPEIVGLDLDVAQRLLVAAGLAVGAADTVAAARVPSGTVTGAEPAPGARVPLGGQVRLHLAK